MHVKFISNEKFEIKTVPRITDPLRTIVLPNGDKIAEIRWLTTSLKFLRYKLILVSDKKIYLKYVTFSVNQSSVCINYHKNLFVKFCEYELTLCGLENLGSTCYFNTFMQMLHTNLINLKNNLSLCKNKGPDFLPENNNTFTFLINYLFKGMKNNTLHKPEPYELIPWNRNEPKDFSHYLRFVFSKIYKDIPQYFSKLEYNVIYECNCKDYFFKNIFEIEVKIKQTNSHFNSVKGGNVSLICYPEKITSSNFINEFTTNSQNDPENYSIYKSLENYFKIKKQCKVHEKEIKKYDFNLKNKGILLIKIKREEKKKKITDYFSYPNELTLKNTKYTLIGVVFHEGDVDNGHYFYVGKVNESFYKFNDEMVSKCNLEDVFVYKNDDLVSYYLTYLKNEEIKCTSDIEENIFNNKIKDYDFSIEECPSFVKEEKKLEENEEIFMTEGQMEINLENKESKESIDLEHREESSPESESHTLFTDLNTNFYKFTREDIPKYLAPHFFCHDYPSVNLRKFYNLDKNDKYVYRFKINETSTEFIKDLRYENECIIYEIISESPFLLENERKLLNNNKINRRKKNNSIIKLETVSQSSDTSTYQTNSTETVNTLSTAKDYTWQSNSSYKKLYFLLKMSKEGCSFLFPRKLQFLNHTLLSHDDLKRMNYYKLIHNGLIEVKNTLSDKINLIFDRYFIIIIEEKNDYLELRNKFRNNKCIKIEDNMIFVGRETKVNELEKIIQRVFLSSSIEIDWDGSLIKKEVKKEVKKESNIVSAELSSYVKKFTYEDDSYMNFLTCKSKENIFVEIKDRSIEGINKLKIIKKDTHCTVKVSFIEEKSDVLDCNKLEHIHYVYINKSITVRRLIHKINVLLCVKNEFTGCVKAVFNTDKIELLNLDDNINPEEGTMVVLHNLEKDVTFLPCVYLNDNKFKGYPFFLNVRGLVNIGELRMKYSLSNVIVWKNSMIVAEEEDFFRGMLGLIEE